MSDPRSPFKKANPAVKDFLLYLLSAGINRLLPFLLLPYIAYMLNNHDFGIYSLYRLYIAFGSVLVLLGMEQGIFRLIPQTDETQRKSLLAAGVVHVLIVSLPIMLIALWLESDLHPILFDKRMNYPLLLLPLFFLLQALSTLVYTYHSARKKSLIYLYLSLLGHGSFFLIFLLGLSAGFGLLAFFAATILSNLLVFAANLKIIISGLRFLKSSYYYRLLKTGLPIMFLTLLTYALYQADHYIIKYFLGVESVGVYNYGYRYASAIYLIVTVTNQVFLPRLYQRGRDMFRKQILAYSLLLTVITEVVFWVLAFAFHYFADWIIPQGFELSKSVLLITGMGYLFYAQSYMLDGWLIFKFRTGYLVILSVIALLLNILLNILFIPVLGMLFAAWSSAFCFLLIWLGVIVLLTKDWPMSLIFKLARNFLMLIFPVFTVFLPSSPLVVGFLLYLLLTLYLVRRYKLLSFVFRQG